MKDKVNINVKKEKSYDKSNLFKGKTYDLAFSGTDIKIKPKKTVNKK